MTSDHGDDTDAGANFRTSQYFSEAWDIVKSNPVPFILGSTLLYIINSFAMGLFVGHWYVGIHYMVRKVRQGEDLEFGDVFRGFDNFIPNMIAGLIFSLCLGIGAAFLLVPGLIIGGILLYVMPLVAFNNESIGDAVNKSKDVAMTSLGHHSLFILSQFLCNFVGVLMCCIGVFVTMPIGFAAQALAYEDRFGR